MKKLWGAALVVAALCACSGDSSNSVAGIGSTTSSHPSGSGAGSSSANYGNGSSRVSVSVGGGSTVDTCGCNSMTQECCLMSGSSNTFGCVPKGTCSTGTQQPPPANDAGTTPQADSGAPPPPAACTGTADCPGQVCCATPNGGPTSATCRGACTNGRVQVCADVTDCPRGDTCTLVGFGQNAIMECVQPPMDAGMDAARPDAGAPPDSGPRDAATPDAAADAAPHDAATGG